MPPILTAAAPDEVFSGLVVRGYVVNIRIRVAPELVVPIWLQGSRVVFALPSITPAVLAENIATPHTKAAVHVGLALPA